MAENIRSEPENLLGRNDEQPEENGPGPTTPPPHHPATSPPDRDFHPLRLLLKGTGYAIELTRPDMVVGRHSGCDIRLPLPDVSRRHCRFAYNEGEWSVHDLQSMNGVYVNGERVIDAPIRAGDQLGIGGFKFEVELGEPRPVPALSTNAQEPDAEHPILGMLKPAGDQGSERRKAS
jgi:hypothetical protein